MKLRSLQGHFGNMNGRKIEFTDGFSHLVLPNGWGKSTLCAFLRVMLYGLDTSKRDTQQTLSDKTRYIPQDGHAMGGRLEIEWNGRRIAILRQTGKGGPMQDFDAFYMDTGEKCRLLTAKNCGQVLLGMGEDAFLSSMMVDGEDMKRPSEELQELLTSMAQTGDATGSTSKALTQLDCWRLDIQSGRGHGELPDAQREQAVLEEQLEQLERLSHDIARQQEKYHKLERTAQQAQDAYEKSCQAYTESQADRENRQRIVREEREQRIREIRTRTPDENLVREAGDILYGYEGAVRLEREKRESMPAIETRRRQAVERMEKAQHEREIEVNRTTKPKIRWVAGIFALIFGILAAATGIMQVEWFPGMQNIAGMLKQSSLPMVLSLLAVVCLLLTFLGSVQKPPKPLPDIDEEKKQLEIEYQHILDEQQMAASVLLEERDRVIEAGKKLSPKVTNVEEAAEAIRSAMADLQLIRREQSALGDVILEIQRGPGSEQGPDEMQQQLDALQAKMAAARRASEAAHEQLLRLQRQADAIGTLESVREKLSACRVRVERLHKQYQAIEHARKIVSSENAALQARISPQITSLAQSYLAYLTADNYQEIRLDDRFRARTAGADGRLLGELQLSSGARDQLYLALRLAVCETLAGAKEAPLILDDPFLTSDDASTERGIALLKEIGRKRQVILLTCRTS